MPQQYMLVMIWYVEVKVIATITILKIYSKFTVYRALRVFGNKRFCMWSWGIHFIFLKICSEWNGWKNGKCLPNIITSAKFICIERICLPHISNFQGWQEAKQMQTKPSWGYLSGFFYFICRNNECHQQQIWLP